MEENKYKDVLKGIIEIIRNAEHSDIGFASICTYIGDHCPELENKDEEIRKKLIEYFKDLMGGWFPYSNEEIIAYLEKLKDFDKQLEDAYKNSDEVQYKRGYDDGYVNGMADGMATANLELEKQNVIKGGNSIDPHFGKPITTTETKYPKFKIGDWVVDEEDNHVYQVKRVVTNVSSGMSGYDLSDGGYFYSTKTNCHLWSIADAKDGDVLAEDSCIFIIQKLGDYSKAAKTYCALHNDGDFDDGSILYFDIDSTKPATKEQRELLFRKMDEAGYEWDATTKELSHKEVTKKSDQDGWNEEDEYLLVETVKHLEELIRIDTVKHCGCDVQYYQRDINWLKSIKDRVQPQPKQVGWSEEDQDFFGMLEGYLEFDYDLSMNDKANTLDWLKSVKYRIQPQPKQDSRWKWEEDDEKFFKENILIGLGNIDSVSPELYSKIIDWINLIKKRLS